MVGLAGLVEWVAQEDNSDECLFYFVDIICNLKHILE